MFLFYTTYQIGVEEREREREREREKKYRGKWKIFGLCNDSILSCVLALSEKGASFAARCKYFQVPKKSVLFDISKIYGWCLVICAIN